MLPGSLSFSDGSVEAQLTTEARNSASAHIDELPTEGVLRVINAAEQESS